jgi:phosphatidylinositol alpha 1,6-mannosyltransferase
MFLGKVELRPHRVAIFTGNYNYVMDGPARALNLLVGFLERQGIEVRIYSPTTNAPAFSPQGNVVSVPSMPLPGRSEYRLGLGLPGAIREDIKAFKPSLFHIASPDLLGHAALKLAREWNLPVVTSYHTRFDTYLRYYGLGFLEPVLTKAMIRFYNQCDQVYAPSQSMAEELRGQGITSDLRLWSRGVDAACFNPAKRDRAWRLAHDVRDSEVLINFTGRLVWEKGLQFLVDTLEQLRARCVPFHCIIVGDGPAKVGLQKKLPGAIFSGHLSGSALARAYASSDIFLNPSLSETFGNTTLEAMACGVPAICADATGSRSLVAHKHTGFLAKPNDKDDFVYWLTKLAKSKALRASFSRASAARSQNFEWNAVLNAVLKNYYDALIDKAEPYAFENLSQQNVSVEAQYGPPMPGAWLGNKALNSNNPHPCAPACSPASVGINAGVKA